MLAVTADFVFNRWDLDILQYYRIRHVPWCVRYHAQGLRPETFEYFSVGRGCGSPELYSVGPDCFEYCFVDEEILKVSHCLDNRLKDDGEVPPPLQYLNNEMLDLS
jgi:hypothetical protein